MHPVKDMGISLAGICRKYPLDLVYGSTETIGLGLTDLYVAQGLRHVEFIQQYLTFQCMSGQLIQTVIEWAQIYLGISTNLFDFDFKRCRHLLPWSFVRTTWEFGSEHNIHIPTHKPFLPLHRKGD